MSKNRTSGGSNTLFFAGIIIAFIAVLAAMFMGVRTFVIQPMKYSDAIELFDSGEYEDAIIAFEDLGEYRNSAVKAKESKYFLAIQQEESGKYQTAIESFNYLGDYKDSYSHLEKCNYALAKQYFEKKDYANALLYINESGVLASKEEIAVIDILNSSVGDTVKFGVYEQDNNRSNGAEPIEWTIIGIHGDQITLLSNKNLECKKYNETWANVSWENCTLREWLNDGFYNVAFKENEKKALTYYYATGDVVYVLSAEEWSSCGITGGTANSDYAIAQGVYNDNGTGWTWLRDEGIDKDHAQEIDCKGNVNTYGSFVDCDNDGVRPAIIICGGNLYE